MIKELCAKYVNKSVKITRKSSNNSDNKMKDTYYVIIIHLGNRTEFEIQMITNTLINKYYKNPKVNCLFRRYYDIYYVLISTC